MFIRLPGVARRPLLTAIPIALLAAACGGADDSSGPSRPGPVARLEAPDDASRSGAAGELVPAGVTVRAVDAQGRGVPGVTIAFAADSGSGSFPARTAVSDTGGRVTVPWRLGTSAYVQNRGAATHEPASGPAVSVRLTAFVRAAAPASLAAASGTFQSVNASATAPQPFGVVVMDRFGNFVPNLTVEWAVVEGTGTLAHARTQSRDDIATTNEFTLGAMGGVARVRARVSGVDSVIFEVNTALAPELLTNMQTALFDVERYNTHVIATLFHGSTLAWIPESDPESRQLVGVGRGPVALELHPSLSSLWVANLVDRSVSVVTTSTRATAATIPMPGEPTAIAFSPNRVHAYVTTHDGTEGRITVVNVLSRAVVRNIPVLAHPRAIVVRPGTSDTTLWVAARDRNALAAYSLATGELRQRIHGCLLPGDFALSADGRTIFATCETGLGLRVIDVATGTTRTAFELAGGFGLALSGDGRTLFAAGMGGTILVVDVPSETVLKAYHAGGVPRRVVADGSDAAYVANERGWVHRVTRD